MSSSLSPDGLSGDSAGSSGSDYSSSLSSLSRLQQQQSSLEGYEHEFDPPVEARYECPICLMVLREPRQTKCGHRFCRDCILRSLKNSFTRCPVDNEPLTAADIFPDNFAKREILNCNIKCPNKNYGCEKVFPLGKLKAHLKECQYALVPCPNKCGCILPQGDMEEHVGRQCGLRVVMCTCCHASMPAQLTQEHVNVCPKVPVNCENCNAEMPRELIEHHVRTTCEKATIFCPFHQLGCVSTMTRCGERDHLVEEAPSHLKQLCGAVVNILSHMSVAEQWQNNRGNRHDHHGNPVATNAQSRAGEIQRPWCPQQERRELTTALDAAPHPHSQHAGGAGYSLGSHGRLQDSRAWLTHTSDGSSLSSATDRTRPYAEGDTQRVGRSHPVPPPVQDQCTVGQSARPVPMAALTEETSVWKGHPDQVQAPAGGSLHPWHSNLGTNQLHSPSSSPLQHGICPGASSQAGSGGRLPPAPSGLEVSSEDCLSPMPAKPGSVVAVSPVSVSAVRENKVSPSLPSQPALSPQGHTQGIQTTQSKSGVSPPQAFLSPGQQLESCPIPRERQLTALAPQQDVSPSPPHAAQPGLGGTTNVAGNMASAIVPLVTSMVEKLTSDLEQKLEDRTKEVAQLKSTVSDLQTQNAELSQAVSELQTLVSTGNSKLCGGMLFWTLRGFSLYKRRALHGEQVTLHSQPFYTGPWGYKMCLRANLTTPQICLNNNNNGSSTPHQPRPAQQSLSLFVHMMQGDNDAVLAWPFTGKIVLTVLDQSRDRSARRSMQETLEAKPNLAAFQRPSVHRNQKGFGFIEFMSVDSIEGGSYLLDDCLVIQAQVLPDNG